MTLSRESRVAIRSTSRGSRGEAIRTLTTIWARVFYHAKTRRFGRLTIRHAYASPPNCGVASAVDLGVGRIDGHLVCGQPGLDACTRTARAAAAGKPERTRTHVADPDRADAPGPTFFDRAMYDLRQ